MSWVSSKMHPQFNDKSHPRGQMALKTKRLKLTSYLEIFKCERVTRYQIEHIEHKLRYIAGR